VLTCRRNRIRFVRLIRWHILFFKPIDNPRRLW
jgi:hypothetical protein